VGGIKEIRKVNRRKKETGRVLQGEGTMKKLGRK
jgi:hypothetical protein